MMIQSRCQFSKPVKYLAILPTLLSLSCDVWADEETSIEVPPALDSSQVRYDLQWNYALQLGESVKKALKVFKEEHSHIRLSEGVNWFADGVLREEEEDAKLKDPFVQEVQYVHETHFIIVMRNNKLIEPQLRGFQIFYNYDPNTQEWERDKEHVPTSDPDDKDWLKGACMDDLDRLKEMCQEKMDMNFYKKQVTIYCATISTSQVIPGMKISDPEWCPHWHNFVMSPE